MKSAVQSFVVACVVCQQAKPDRSKLPGLLQPLPVPDSAWSVISMDFIEGFPSSHGYNCILVVVDLFSKYAHFLPLKHPFTARSVAQSFISQVYNLYGMPQAIVSDRDKVFTSHFWRELFQLAGIELRMSTAYHPQMNGQPNGSINALRHSCVALCMLARISGDSGWIKPSFGITPIGIQLWGVLLLRYCMVMHRAILALPLLQTRTFLIWLLDCLTEP